MHVTVVMACGRIPIQYVRERVAFQAWQPMGTVGFDTSLKVVAAILQCAGMR